MNLDKEIIKKYFFPLAVALVIIGTMVMIFNKPNQAPRQQPQEDRGKSITLKDGEHLVRITSSGFEPSVVEIYRGDTVVFLNNDTDERWPASDNHPSHEIYPQFDPNRPLEAGEKWIFTFERVGTWNYHDHIYPSMGGTIVVRE